MEQSLEPFRKKAQPAATVQRKNGRRRRQVISAAYALTLAASVMAAGGGKQFSGGAARLQALEWKRTFFVRYKVTGSLCLTSPPRPALQFKFYSHKVAFPYFTLFNYRKPIMVDA